MKAHPASAVTGSWTYVPLADRGDDVPLDARSSFTLTPLTIDERHALLDEAEIVVEGPNGQREIRPRTFRQALAVVRAHLVGWDRFPSDNPQPFPAGATREQMDRALTLLGESVIHELSLEVWRKSALGEQNGGSPTRPPTSN